ncbi:hypothetical protein LEP1GSC007_0441 [Leptospira interrogans serovar Bulgarica str. Mallika]|nr:hypothetical protein LEP1GSC007_0441 [Leptospira interrogans serovar Bulgarica str. Mallika]
MGVLTFSRFVRKIKVGWEFPHFQDLSVKSKFGGVPTFSGFVRKIKVWWEFPQTFK